MRKYAQGTNLAPGASMRSVAVRLRVLAVLAETAVAAFAGFVRPPSNFVLAIATGS